MELGGARSEIFRLSFWVWPRIDYTSNLRWSRELTRMPGKKIATRKSHLTSPGQTTLLAQTVERRATAPYLLEQLLPSTREAVMALARRVAFGPGEVLFQQGDPHTGIFLIEEGIVRSFYCSEDGRELTLGFWSNGHYVGAPHMFGGGQHAWTSEARAPTKCLYLPAAGLQKLSRQHVDLANALLDALVHKSECYCALLQLLATHSMKVRLARLLLMLGMQEDTVTTVFTHRELAGMIGSTRQWVSQTLVMFESMGLIQKYPDGTLRVLHPGQLSALR
jgi:CRP-like cAMP-binding protein